MCRDQTMKHWTGRGTCNLWYIWINIYRDILLFVPRRLQWWQCQCLQCQWGFDQQQQCGQQQRRSLVQFPHDNNKIIHNTIKCAIRYYTFEQMQNRGNKYSPWSNPKHLMYNWIYCVSREIEGAISKIIHRQGFESLVYV